MVDELNVFTKSTKKKLSKFGLSKKKKKKNYIIFHNNYP